MILQLFDWGYLPILYPANLKNPVKTNWGHRRYTRDELARCLSSVPNESAIGLILGKAGRLIDIEIDDREAAAAELAELFPNGLPDAPGHDSKRGGHYFFAWDDRLDVIRKNRVYWNKDTEAVEIRLGCCDRQTQSRIAPSKGMTWRKPLSADPMPLPDDVIERLIAKFAQPARIEPLQPASRDWFDTVCDDPQLREKAVSALWACKCYDSYDDWRAIGMALHSIDPELFDEWDKWSRQSSKYRDGDTTKQWNGFGAGTITAGTLFHYAKQDKWEWQPPTAPEPEPESMDSPEPTWAKVFPISYFDDEPEPRVYSIDNILVEGECCIIGGAMKTLKTSVAMDMALSLRSGEPFLGKFAVTQPDAEFGALPTVLFMSAESGKQTLHDLRLRICQSKGLDPQSDLARIAFCPIVPKFGNQKMMDVFRQALDELQPSFLFVDPAYIAMPAGVSFSLADMGVALYEMINTAADRGITFILLAHHKKNQQRRPPTLDDLSGVGYAEAFRQWLLLNRIAGYKNDGHHELYMMAGGSAGHDGLYTLHVDEGKRPKESSDPPRRWEISKIVLSDEDTDSADRQDYIDKRDEILAAIRDAGPQTKTEIAKAVKLKNKMEVVEDHLKTLIQLGSVECFPDKRGKATVESDYYRLTEAEIEAQKIVQSLSA